MKTGLMPRRIFFLSALMLSAGAAAGCSSKDKEGAGVEEGMT
ncbi:hypothetical protein WMF26_47320 [Sorangium sp. So ce185]